MTKQEFQERTNLQVTDEQFDKINNIYMACPDIQKDEFCDLYVNDKDKLMAMLMSEINEKEAKIEELEGLCSAYESQLDLDAEKLLRAAFVTGNADMFDYASERLGHYRTVQICKDIFMRDYYKPTNRES